MEKENSRELINAIFCVDKNEMIFNTIGLLNDPNLHLKFFNNLLIENIVMMNYRTYVNLSGTKGKKFLEQITAIVINDKNNGEKLHNPLPLLNSGNIHFVESVIEGIELSRQINQSKNKKIYAFCNGELYTNIVQELSTIIVCKSDRDTRAFLLFDKSKLVDFKEEIITFPPYEASNVEKNSIERNTLNPAPYLIRKYTKFTTL